MDENPHTFDRDRVTTAVTTRVDELWQGMVNITDGAWWSTSPSTISQDNAIDATRTLRGQISQALMEIGNCFGFAGELLAPEPFVESANRTFRDIVAPQCQLIHCPPKSYVAPVADPNWLMAEVMIDTWKQRFFQPQRTNAERMLAGLVASARYNQEAARRVDELLMRLRESKIRRYDHSLFRLLGDVIHVLQLYTPRVANGSETVIDIQREFMEMAVREARKSVGEHDRTHPRVGAVVVKNGKVLATAYRGELNNGEHAEFTALERKLADEVVAGSTVYTTLEPCTTRKHPKVPCADRLIQRKVKRVVIGMLDPNRDICGKGYQKLRDANVSVHLFDDDLKSEIEDMNREFAGQHRGKDRRAGGDSSSSPWEE